jgi:hypothetical protein
MHIPNVLDQLHNAGYQLSYLEGHLYGFDSFLDGMYPGIEKIDKTICEKWIYMEDKYTPHSLQQRVSTIKYLGKYLGSIGINLISLIMALILALIDSLLYLMIIS